MANAAVPAYMHIDPLALPPPPGHKYGIYFPIWSNDWKKVDGEKNSALKEVFDYERFKPLTESLLSRQQSVSEDLGDAVFSLPAQSLSPFMTGTGMEHPLENGFAFLSPYGLPYLPGSGVKGVLRRTAEYLSNLEFNDADCSWNNAAIDVLFGPGTNADENARRGALVFWDIYIQPKDYKLGMDILTPHYGDYYKGDTTPHDSGQPVPVPFLVIPQEAKFQFYVQCNAEFIQDEQLKNNWRTLVKTLLEHSFEWLGFGAKTASGYGQLKVEAGARKKLEEKEAELKKAAMPAVERILEELSKVESEERKINRKQAGGPLDNEVGKAVKAASDLSDADRLRIYQACKSALEWLGKDKKKAKEKLAPLNVTLG
jgi:CRISPR-associated protein Cmr6